MIQVNVFDLSEKSDVTCVFIIGLVLHIFNAILASILASELSFVSSEKDKKESQHCSVLAVLILAVHPVFTEVVVWVSAQPYLLATFFSLCALLCQIRGVSQFLGNTFIILAIMSKLAAISVIPFSILLEMYLRYSKKRFRRESIQNFCLAHVMCVSIALFFIFKTKQYNGVADVRGVRARSARMYLFSFTHSEVSLVSLVQPISLILVTLSLPSLAIISLERYEYSTRASRSNTGTFSLPSQRTY